MGSKLEVTKFNYIQNKATVLKKWTSVGAYQAGVGGITIGLDGKVEVYSTRENAYFDTFEDFINAVIKNKVY